MARADRRWNSLCFVFCVGIVFRAGIGFGEETIEIAAKSLIAQKCLACHHGDEAKGKLDLSTRDALVRGGENGAAISMNAPADSLVLQRIERDEMPPRHPLSEKEKKLMKDWVLAGSAWRGGPLDPSALTSEHRAGLDWWSLQPIHPVSIPSLDSSQIRRQPIDAFVLNKLDSVNLSINRPAIRSVLVRRVSFDLLGLPPTIAEVDQFLQDDNPDAVERLIDRLLASPHYGERWARHWLDVVRFGESHGFERDLPRPNAWHYRDWVIQALNRDLPYDEFVRWQLAGDLLSPDDADAWKAVGFLVAGPHDTVVPVIDSMRAMMRQDELEDIVGTVGQTFLGLTVNCARCHDHKFDPISTREYYQLAAALAGIDHGERKILPEPVARELDRMQSRINQVSASLRQQTQVIRDRLLVDRTTQGSTSGRELRFPVPIAAWDFTQDLRDQIGELHVTLVGSAKRTDDGIEFDGASFGKTSTLPLDLRERTLEVRLRLKTLGQSGGGAISLQSMDGQVFDAIAYAETEAGRWLAGSNSFVRTLPFEAAMEDVADQDVVTITLVYQADGTITAYRNGEPYGHSIRKSEAARYEAGKSQLLFGMRHGTAAGGNRMLTGTITGARLFGTPLHPEEVAHSANSPDLQATETEILASLSTDAQATRRALQNERAQLQARHRQLSKNGPLQIYTTIATQPSPMKIHRRGSVLSLGDAVSAAGLASVRGLSPDFGLRPDAIESHRRRELANWITNPQNPLFRRTMVNRVWHYYFGAGLVDSPNDLGFHGGQPTHPELLEWLSHEFSDFSLKRLHRLMVTSATYHQSSADNPAARRIDAGNRYLWRKSPRRLEAEEVRDAILVVAEQLNPQLHGKGYSDVNSYFFKGTQFYDPIDPPGFVNQRRTVYRMWARSGRSPFLDTFDCPDPSTATPRRTSTVTPLQALSLLNHSFSLRMADRFADRLTREAGGSRESQVRIAYRSLFSRDPSADEVTLCLQFIERRGLSEFCRAMWNSSEFLFLD